MTTLGLKPVSKPEGHQLLWLDNNFTPPYSPDLVPSDFHLFKPLKESLRGRHFSSHEKIKTTVKEWLKAQPVEFYNEGICSLVQRWEKAVRKAGDCIEK